MRTNLELWLIVEQNFEEFFGFGLCGILSNLWYYGLIESNEREYLEDIIKNYKDIRGDKYCNTGFIWRAGEAKPRRIFIQNQILKLIRDEKK